MLLSYIGNSHFPKRMQLCSNSEKYNFTQSNCVFPRSPVANETTKHQVIRQTEEEVSKRDET